MSKGFAHIFLILVLGVVAVGGAYYLGRVTSPEDALPTTTSQPVTMLPEGWELMESEYCEVSVPLPPKEEPYYIPEGEIVGVSDQGTFWHFEDTDDGNGWTPILNSGSPRAIAKRSDASSGYIPGAVEVYCGANDQNYSNKELQSYLQETFPESNESLNEIQALGQLVFEYGNTEKMWGREVIVGKFVGGASGEEPNYFFATDDSLYMVRKMSMSENETIQETTDIIFDNLQFD